MTIVRLQHSSLQFSDSTSEHKHDAEMLLRHAEESKVDFLTGTEAGTKEYQQLLIDAGHRHDFFVFAHPYGEWVGVNLRSFRIQNYALSGPFIEATKAHSARGIAHLTARHRGADLGRVTVGSMHALAPHSLAKGETNHALWDGVAQYGEQYGRGGDIVFLSGDLNQQDDKVDVFHGAPFTTIADEVNRHPDTHGNHDIDVIASYDKDKRVNAHSYRVLDDQDLRLFGDHFVLEAAFEVAAR